MMKVQATGGARGFHTNLSVKRNIIAGVVRERPSAVTGVEEPSTGQVPHGQHS